MIKYELLRVEGAPQRNGRVLAFLRAIVTPDETHHTVVELAQAARARDLVLPEWDLLVGLVQTGTLPGHQAFVDAFDKLTEGITSQLLVLPQEVADDNEVAVCVWGFQLRMVQFWLNGPSNVEIDWINPPPLYLFVWALPVAAPN